LLNRFFNESEPCFGPASAILPPFNFSFESTDPIFGGLMLTSYFLRCKLKYLFGYIDRFLSGDSGFSPEYEMINTQRLRIPLAFEVGNQALKKCHLAAPSNQMHGGS
jgi:hypothetical protein